MSHKSFGPGRFTPDLPWFDWEENPMPGLYLVFSPHCQMETRCTASSFSEASTQLWGTSFQNLPSHLATPLSDEQACPTLLWTCTLQWLCCHQTWLIFLLSETKRGIGGSRILKGGGADCVVHHCIWWHKSSFLQVKETRSICQGRTAVLINFWIEGKKI